MYSYPLVYDKPYEKPPAIGDLPPMYELKPYFHDQSSSLTSSSSVNMDTLPDVPASLPSIEGKLVQHDLANNTRALEDVISRQLALLCRLNDLERLLVTGEEVPSSTKVEKAAAAAESVTSTPSLLNFPPPGKQEDIVVHFQLDSIPYTLFTLLKHLDHSHPVKILVSLHLSSQWMVANQQTVRGTPKPLANLHKNLDKIHFKPTPSEQVLSRSLCNLLVTFIVDATTSEGSSTQPKAIFHANQPPVVGELAIVQRLLELLQPKPIIEQIKQFWLNQEPTQLVQLLSSERDAFEKLGSRIVRLSSSTFALGQSTKGPSLLDILLWSLVQFNSKESATKLATSLSQAFPPAWIDAVGKSIFG